MLAILYVDNLWMKCIHNVLAILPHKTKNDDVPNNQRLIVATTVAMLTLLE